MNNISTGQPSNLETYRQIAYVLDGFKVGPATEFIDKKINESPNKEKEEVIAPESQVLYLLYKLAFSSEDKNEDS